MDETTEALDAEVNDSSNTATMDKRPIPLVGVVDILERTANIKKKHVTVTLHLILRILNLLKLVQFRILKYAWKCDFELRSWKNGIIYIYRYIYSYTAHKNFTDQKHGEKHA